MGSEDDRLFYLGVVKTLEREGERRAVVRTLNRCDVSCSYRGCDGVERVRVGQLVKIAHHVSGEHAGETFIECTAEECTPVDTPLAPRSRVGSRSGSRERSRTRPGAS